MVYRFKFRVRGSEPSGKFVFTLEEGKEIFLDMTFQPSPVHTELTCLFLEVVDGRSLLHFLNSEMLWNNKPAPKGPVEIHPGHLIQLGSQSVEILECPEHREERETTTFLDLAAMAVAAISPKPKAEGAETPSAPALAAAPAPPAPPPREITRNVSLPKELTGTLPPLAGPDARSAIQPMPSASLNAPDSVAVPEPGDFFNPNSLQREPSGKIHIVEAPVFFDPGKKISTPAAVSVIFFALGVAALFVPESPLLQHWQSRHHPPMPPPPPVPEFREQAAQLPQAPVPPVAQNVPTRESVLEFLEAVKRNDLAGVRSAVDNGKVRLDQVRDEAGRPALARAAAYGNDGIVRYLHSVHADINSPDTNGNSALMWAVANGHESTVALLTSLGADPLWKRSDGTTALAIALNSGNERIRAQLEAATRLPISAASPRVPASLPKANP
jgi:Ankyrin repeats (3 copies)